MASLIQVSNIFKTFSVSASSNGSAGPTNGGGTGPVIVELPLEKIRRPLMRTRANDQNKVQHLMDSISQIGLQVPVSLAAIGMKPINALASQQSAVKSVVERKKL